MRPIFLIAPLVAALSVAEPGCGDKDDTKPESDADADTDADADADTDADVELTSRHTGWEQPCCWNCHAEDGHNSGLDPYECVTCHGRNGAEDGHTTTTPCSTCHEGVVHDCTAGDFPDPDACQTCHVLGGDDDDR